MDWANQGKKSFGVKAVLLTRDARERQNIASYSPPASITITGTQEVSGGKHSGEMEQASQRKG